MQDSNQSNSAHWKAGGEHAGIRVGRMGPTGTRRSGRGTVSGRSGFGARLFESAGDNGGEVRAEPVHTGRRRAFVSDWRPGEVAADGTLEFLGRVDQQVKVRGYRIELG